MPEHDDIAVLQAAIDAQVAKAVEDTTAIFAAQYLAEQDAFQKAVDAATTEGTPLEKRADLPEEVRKALAEGKAEREALAKSLAAIEDARTAERMDGIAKGLPFIAKSDDIEGDATAELAEFLGGVAKAVTPEQFTQLVGILDAAQSAIAKGELLAERGQGQGAMTSAEQMLEKRAEALRIAEPTMTYSQSIAKALDPELYGKIQTEGRA